MIMGNVLRISIICALVLLSSCTIDTSKDNESSYKTVDDGSGADIRRHLATVPGRRLGRLNRNPSREEIESLRKSLEGLEPSEWNQFSSPDKVVDGMDCFVEVQVTQKVPGKCTVLGGRVPVCRADKLVTLDPNSCSMV